MAWLVEGDDDEPDIEIYDSSPILSRKRPSSARPAPNPDDTVEIVDHYIPPSPTNRGSRQSQFRPDDSDEIMEDDSIEVLPSKPPTASPLIPPHINSLSPRGKKVLRNNDMLPPDFPVRFAIPTPASASDLEYPEPSFAVRPAGKRLKKRIVTPSDPESPDLRHPLRQRLQRKSFESPDPDPRTKRQEEPDAPRKHNPWIDTEAAHSGDEVSEGSSQVDEVETEFDRQFLRGHPETQVSPSYDQTLAYRQSLFTQAPAKGKAPVFANRPAARGALYVTGPGPRHHRPLVSSSPPVDDDEPNEYDMGSFVVDDDAEIVYASSDL